MDANSKFIKGGWQHSDEAKKIVQQILKKKFMILMEQINLKSLGHKDCGIHTAQLRVG